MNILAQRSQYTLGISAWYPERTQRAPVAVYFNAIRIHNPASGSMMKMYAVSDPSTIVFYLLQQMHW